MRATSTNFGSLSAARDHMRPRRARGRAPARPDQLRFIQPTFDRMPSQPLHVAILWHQHQPYYKQGESYLLPWTRLHATKDYRDIATALEKFPKLRQTINVVPSLLIQLIDYAEHGAVDRVLELTRRPADELTSEEQIAILRSFFLCNVERMVRPVPRYNELYEKAGHGTGGDLELALRAAAFAAQDWLDLQVWYNLAWIGDYSREDPRIAPLLAKGGNFTEADKERLLAVSLEIVGDVIPTYRRLMESGQIELSVTPFYHPILPILCDSFAALEALPNSELPAHHINFPEDARVHIARAIELFREQFGRDPIGMWPSEGSVSDAAVALIRGAGLTWTATDEGVLRRTLGERWSDLAKYFPYTLKTRNGPISMVFRDHELSDAIGFVYSSWAPEAAALDFYDRLVEIRSRIIQELGADALDDALVPVILDGENCWEYYERNGRPFLEALYRLLSESNEIATTTVSEALAVRTQRPERTLGRIYAGSWIGANFKIWIGHEEDNAAWDALASARETLMRKKDDIDEALFATAMEEIYIAEGSDWFWWYGDENSSVNQDDFDELFRSHLKNVYTMIGLEVPSYLALPIRRAARAPRITPPTRYIAPSVDGRRSSATEWDGAGSFVIDYVGGAMHRAEAFERRFWFGRDGSTLFVRFDTATPLAGGVAVRIELRGSRPVTLHFTERSIGIETATDETGKAVMAGIIGAVGETIEAAVPMTHLVIDGEELTSLGIVCEVFEHGHPTERIPKQGELLCPMSAA
jgi:alpha-amylase/alpha-mannosidase (GH57 family)